ncbi:retrovirus-related pol polyprotein from transposon TNT 1-94 [Tanacetum coccineum]
MFHHPLILLQIVQLILFIVDSGCTKHMTGNLKLLGNFVERYMGTVRFGNDQFALILGYGDLVQGNITIKKVYYVEGLNHNLFSVGQFFDADLEVAFRKSTCFVRDLQGNDLLTGNHGSDLYTISLQETTSSTPICLMAKASPTEAWLWHRRLSHFNFDYINLLSKKDVVIGLPKLKYVKDQLCSSCEVSKEKRSSFKIKAVSSSKGWLNLLHMDLCGPMRVASINGKKYILESDYDNSVPVSQLQHVSPSTNTIAPSQQEFDLLFGALYDEFFTTCTSSVNNSSSPIDNSKQQDTPPTTNIQSSTESTTLTSNVHAEENNNSQVADTQFQQDKFINPFCRCPFARDRSFRIFIGICCTQVLSNLSDGLENGISWNWSIEVVVYVAATRWVVRWILMPGVDSNAGDSRGVGDSFAHCDEDLRMGAVMWIILLRVPVEDYQPECPEEICGVYTLHMRLCYVTDMSIDSVLLKPSIYALFLMIDESPTARLKEFESSAGSETRYISNARWCEGGGGGIALQWSSQKASTCGDKAFNLWMLGRAS